MSNTSLIPGVYPDYSSSSVTYERGKLIGIAAVTNIGTDLEHYTITNTDECATFFGDDGNGAIINSMADIIFQNGGTSLVVVPVSSVNDYYSAFSSLLSSNIPIILSDSPIGTVTETLASLLEDFAEDGVESVGIGFTSYTDENDISELMNGLCCERLIMTLDFEAACGIAGLLASLAAPTDSISGSELYGLSEYARFSDKEEQEFLIGAGISPIEEATGAARLVRCVSTRTILNGADDNFFLPINSILITDDVVSAVRTGVTEAITLASSGKLSRSAVISKAMMILSDKQSAGIISSYGEPVATADSGTDTLSLALTFTPVNSLNRICITAEISA